MHRTEGYNNDDYQFTDGPPATVVESAWLNSVQEEICNVIEEAGIVVRDKATDTQQNQLFTAIAAIATLYAGIPVHGFYVQYPDADSNDPATAFPVAGSPAALFGGTWEAKWNTEAVAFRTQGDPFVAETETAGRTNGLQADQSQGHYHSGHPSSSGICHLTHGSGGITMGPGTNYTNIASTGAEVTNGTHGAPRVGYETRMKNRLIIVWKRTA